MMAPPLLPLALWCLCLGALAERQVDEEACEDAELTRADLLQTGMSRSTPAAAGPTSSAALAASRAESVKPAYWMHVSKTGSTFESVLLGNPTLCPGFVDETETGLFDTSLTSDEYRFMMASPQYTSEIRTACPGAFQIGTLGNHNGLGGFSDDERLGHGMAMLRQPEQRLISSYQDGQHDWPLHTPRALSLVEYAEVVAGCTVKMLTRSGTNVCQMDPTLPLDSEVTEAVLRIEKDFAFVGVTDEWYTSVCLFHAMFGGTARAIELLNVNSEHGTVGVRADLNTSQYDTTELEGFTDRYDGPVFEKATYLFQKNIQLYGLSEDSCLSLMGI